MYVPPSTTLSSAASEVISRDELVQALRDQIEDLRRERDEWREQARVADRLLSAALERIPPQLEAPRAERESPESEASPAPTDTTVEPTGEAEEGVQRPWWRRMWG